MSQQTINLIYIFWAKYLFVFIIIFFWIYFLIQNREKQLEMIKFAIIVLPLIYITAKISSLFFYNPRPFVVWNFIPLIPHSPDNWFPSDHTLISSAFAMLWFVYNKKLWIALWIIAILVWLSRVAVWVHHLVDVIGSMVIAIVISLIIEKLTSIKKS